MKEELMNSVKSTVKHWWVSPLIGILAIILGVMFIATPFDALLTISLVFAIGFIASGITEIAFSITNRKAIDNWGWMLAGGIIDFLFGTLLASYPGMTALLLVFFVGFWLLFRSIWGINGAFEMKRLGFEGWGWMLALAILALLFSFLILVIPSLGATYIVAFAATSFIIYGIFRIALGFRLKSAKNWFDKNLK